MDGLNEAWRKYNSSKKEASAVVPRPYQRELSKHAKEGKNSVVYAPGGSGKTLVAVDILLDHLEKPAASNRRKCVFFLVNSSLRRTKIEEAISEYGIPYGVYDSRSDDEEVSLKTLMERYTVVILTAHVFLSILEAAEYPHELSFEDLSLLVFDECHRAIKEHCYNHIMRHYIRAKKHPRHVVMRPLPQVVGLTSTLNFGHKDSVKTAVEKAKMTCAHLDAEALSVVSEHADDLRSHLRIYSEMDELEVPQRDDDQCHKIISEHMDAIHERMRTIRQDADITERKKERLERSLEQLPEDYASRHYHRWIRRFKFSVQTIKNCPQKFALLYCSKYLIMYNQALIINAQVRTTDAVASLKADVDAHRNTYAEEKKHKPISEELRTAFDEHYNDIEAKLNPVAENERFANPLLVLLKHKIQELSSANGCGIIMVEMKAAPEWFQRWMEADEQLALLRPLVLSGEDKEDRSGHRVLISSTAKAAESSNINWVIRLMYSIRRIEVIRVRGGDNSVSWPYSELVSGAVLNRAALKVSQMSDEDFRKAMDAIQNEELKELDRKAEKDASRRNGMTTTYQLHCLGCDTFVCDSVDLRVYNRNHRTTLGRGFPRLYQRKPHPEPVVYRDIVIREKIHCRKCDIDWGNFARIMDLWMPVLKSEGFVLRHERKHETYKTWKQVPLNIGPLQEREKGIILRQFDQG